jgi:hypothetical protein
MPLDQQFDHDLFNLSVLLSYSHPLFCIYWRRTTAFVHLLTGADHYLIAPSSRPLNTFDENDLVFASVKFVADDYLVAVTFQRGFRFWNEECVFGLQLHRATGEYYCGTHEGGVEVREI